MTAAAGLKFSVHGLAVQIDCRVPSLGSELQQAFAPFEVSDWPAGFVPIDGIIRPYDSAEVLRHVSATAVPVDTGDPLLEVYQEGERFWLINDRWGLTEINFLKGHWRSWVLENPAAGATKTHEMAVLWPLAQLLRLKGLYLLPAVSVVKQGRGMLLLSPFNIENDLPAFVANGYRIIGQPWTALREEAGKVELLSFPLHVPMRTNLLGNAEIPAPHAFCDAVVIMDHGRRPVANLQQVPAEVTADFIRHAWPIVELHPNRRRQNPLPARLAQSAQCYRAQISRRPEQLIDQIEQMQAVRFRDHAGGFLSATIAPGASGLSMAAANFALSAGRPTRRALAV